MGEIADMMLDGTLCQECGGLMPDQSPSEAELAAAPKNKKGLPIIDRVAPGYPRSCPDCKPRRETHSKPGKGCPRCPLRFPNGNERRKHLRDAHGLKFDTKRIGCLIPIKGPA